jgi:transposase-like protein
MQLKTKSTYNVDQLTRIPVTEKEPNRQDPEVLEKKPRRRFTAKYKLRILAEVDACTKPGDIGALLRREGLYYSNIHTWQRQKKKGALKGLSPQKRGRKKHEVNPLAKRVAELERDNAKLSKKLKQAETIIEVQKKISEVLGISQPENNGESS